MKLEWLEESYVDTDTDEELSQFKPKIEKESDDESEENSCSDDEFDNNEDIDDEFDSNEDSDENSNYKYDDSEYSYDYENALEVTDDGTGKFEDSYGSDSTD